VGNKAFNLFKRHVAQIWFITVILHVVFFDTLYELLQIIDKNNYISAITKRENSQGLFTIIQARLLKKDLLW
jgi:hypothetical protein